MNIARGVRLGPYEVVEAIGAGGMGEVYRATDTRLDRVVALKVLPSHLSSNPELRERFDREARTISSLSHPHICTLYDVGHHDGIDYLVMEFVEGESLEQRLKKGPLPLDQTLRYGIEIAEALDKAHRQGIVHRDLKPANIMITKSGAKLLDFGLAKIVAPETPVVQLSHLPTAQRQLTQEGAILGTFQYMAPEQLEGQEADARTDIFALGTVLYEMATGRHAFEGKTKTSLIAAIVDREPPAMSTIRPMTPPAFERVVKTCLAKDPDDRWQSARDVAKELRWIQQGGSATAIRPARSREWIAWTLAAVALAVAAVFAYLLHRATVELPPRVEAAILPPEKTAFALTGPTPEFALSPDGRRLAMRVTADGRRTIWIRPLDSSSAQPLLGTDGATFMFWSPDSRYLAFFSGSKLKKIDVSGGPPQVICDVGSQPRGGSWSKDGTILFTAHARVALSKVPSAGGTPSAATQLQKNEYSHRWPAFLPDGRHFLYVAQTISGQSESRNMLYEGSLDSSERRPLFAVNGPALYSSDGYLVFLRETTLFAQQFDAEKLHVRGEAVPIVEKIQTYSNSLAAMFSLSNTGILAFQPAQDVTGLQLEWVNRSGKELETLTPPGDYSRPALSHDGKRVAYEQHAAGAGTDIWILDLVRHVPTRLTFEPQDDIGPIWSPDDSKIAYSSPQPNGTYDVFQKASTGTSSAERLWGTLGAIFVGQWNRDGSIVHWSLEPQSNSFDIGRISVQSRTSTPLIASRFDDMSPQVSPDGRWLAYSSNVSNQTEIYIEPYPPTGAKWQVSSNGGISPRWRRDGQELFFVGLDERLMSVNIHATATGLEISTPAPLFQTHLAPGTGFQYDVSADGQRFLLNAFTGRDDKTIIQLVTNWPSSLRR
jgi:Tol biopolymer transport system component/predicted Ser/Thr protein kinase